jgi:hypothetical protein
MPQATFGTPSGFAVVPQPIWFARPNVSSMLLFVVEVVEIAVTVALGV